MTRTAKATDFTVPVQDVGTFTFGRRTMRDEIAIQVEFARIIEGVEPTAWLQTVGGWMSALKVMTVRAPDGFDIEALDPLDDDTYAKLAKVHDALSEKERSFRRKPDVASEGSGESAPGDNRV